MKNRLVRTLTIAMTAAVVLSMSSVSFAEEAVQETAEEAAGALQENLEEAAGAVQENLEEAAGAVKEAVEGAAEEAQAAVQELAQDAQAAAQDIAENAQAAAEEFMENADAALQEAAGAADEALAETEEAAEEVAEEAAEEEEWEDTGVAPETPGEVYEPSVDPAAPKDQAILVVSFGTSFNQNRADTICAVENALAAAYPEYDVRRAFTAQIIIDKVAKRDNVIIDNVGEALERAIADGVKTLIVQPTHLMHGFEYNDLEAELAEYADSFDAVVLAEPLLTSDDDFSRVAQAIVDGTKDHDDGKTAICFMGHGTEAESNVVYGQMQEVLSGMEMANYYVGTVEATPSLDDVLAAVKEGEYEKVVLEPLMVVAGDHANNDMAGDEEDSWKSAFAAEGYEVECILKGLGSFEEIQKLYIEHTQAAIDTLA